MINAKELYLKLKEMRDVYKAVPHTLEVHEQQWVNTYERSLTLPEQAFALINNGPPTAFKFGGKIVHVKYVDDNTRWHLLGSTTPDAEGKGQEIWLNGSYGF